MTASSESPQQKNYVRFLMLVATVLVVSGLVHTIVLLVTATPWGGFVSWRKPIVFSLSFAITNLTLALVLHQLPRATWRGWILALSFGLSSLAEVGLITLQQWRGVPSHFNAETPFDLWIVIALGVFFMPLMLSILGIAVWSWVSLPGESAFALGLKLGMVFLILGQVTGLIVLFAGIDLLRQNGGNIEALYPTVTRYKFSHAVSLHAIQVLAVLGAIADRMCGIRSSGRWILCLVSFVALVAIGYSLWNVS